MRDLQQKIKIDQNALNDELVKQPELYLEASQSYVQAVSDRDKAKADLDLARAETDFRIRAQREAAGEKVTESLISSAIEQDRKYRKANTEFLDAKRIASEAEALKDAFGQRGYVLKDLAALYIAGYFAANSVKGAESTEVQRRDYERRRKEISQQRSRLR